MPEIIVKLGDNVIQRYLFCQDRLTIGRAQENDIVIENLAISRLHAVIEREPDGYFVADHNSSNGTLINGTRVKRGQVVNRDVISIGKYQLYFFDTRNDEIRKSMPCDQERTMLVPAEAEPLPPEIVITRGKQKGLRVRLAGSSVSVGRGTDNMIRLTDWLVSRHHAVIEKRGKEYVIRDLQSWRHTTVNGQMVKEAVLHDGDAIGFGPTVDAEFTMPEPAMPIMRPRLPQEMAPEYPEPESPQHLEAAQEAAGRAVEQAAEPVPEVVEDVFDFQEEKAEKQEDEDAGAQADSEPIPVEAHVEEAAAEAEAVAADSLPTDVRSVMEDMAVVSLHIAASETSKDLNRELNIKHEAAADARQQIDEIHMWENALKNKSQAIRRQAARRLKQLTGHDYEYE
ncbi:FHA domain-containing protein [bacterium]|nr:FHA domain-containing protein [bacterium]